VLAATGTVAPITVTAGAGALGALGSGLGGALGSAGASGIVNGGNPNGDVTAGAADVTRLGQPFGGGLTAVDQAVGGAGDGTVAPITVTAPQTTDLAIPGILPGNQYDYIGPSSTLQQADYLTRNDGQMGESGGIRPTDVVGQVIGNSAGGAIVDSLAGLIGLGGGSRPNLGEIEDGMPQGPPTGTVSPGPGGPGGPGGGSGGVSTGPGPVTPGAPGPTPVSVGGGGSAAAGGSGAPALSRIEAGTEAAAPLSGSASRDTQGSMAPDIYPWRRLA
jgi:hypothetical protein